MRALSIAATGMNAQQKNLEVIAHNIANINTTGFKRARAEFTESLAFDQWAEDWRARLQDEPDPQAVMARANPLRIARNHQVEAMIEAALAGDYDPFHNLNAALADPFVSDARFLKYETAPRPKERVSRTFCGT